MPFNGYEGYGSVNWSWHPKAGAHKRMAEQVLSCTKDPMTCDSPERRTTKPARAAPAEPDNCLVGCADLTLSDRWTDLRPGPLRSDGPGMTDTLIQALYLPECEAGDGGPAEGTRIERVTTGDLTGDGWNEAVVVLECAPVTSTWPEHVVVLEGFGGPRTSSRLDPEITNGTLVGTSTRPATTLENLEPVVEGGELMIAGDARTNTVTSASAAEYTYQQSFRRVGDRWKVGPVEFSPR